MKSWRMAMPIHTPTTVILILLTVRLSPIHSPLVAAPMNLGRDAGIMKAALVKCTTLVVQYHLLHHSDQLINQLVNHLINHHSDQLINHLINHHSDQLINQLISHHLNHHINQLVNQLVSHRIAASINTSIKIASIFLLT